MSLVVYAPLPFDSSFVKRVEVRVACSLVFLALLFLATLLRLQVASIYGLSGAKSSIAVLPRIHKNKHNRANYRRKIMIKNCKIKTIEELILTN